MLYDNHNSSCALIRLLNEFLLIKEGDVQIAVTADDPMVRPAAFLIGHPPKEDVLAGRYLNFPILAIIKDNEGNILPEPICIDGYSVEVCLLSRQVQEELRPIKRPTK